MTSSQVKRVAGTLAAAIWIFGGASFFFFHFTVVFYEANKAALHGVLDRLWQILE